eukprot:gene48678-59601_t
MTGIQVQGTEQVLRGTLAACKFTLFQIEADRVTAAVSVNMPREGRVIKRLIETGRAVDKTALADPAVRLDAI